MRFLARIRHRIATIVLDANSFWSITMDDEMRVRKNYYQLTSAEREEFIGAVLALKLSGRYDEIVKIHQDSMDHSTPWEHDERPNRRNAAHRGPAFLPWHRQYLQTYEQALQEISGNDELSLPYWNWIEDGKLTDPTTAALWTTEGIGGNGTLSKGWAVTTGPFANWPLAHNGGSQPDVLQRQIGLATSNLPGEQALQQMLGQTQYDNKPWDENRDVESLRSVLEGWFVSDDGSRLHNQVHIWVGGSMGPATSPNDPVFFMHHCMVDKLWADWQLLQQTKDPDLAASYAPHCDGPPGHNLDDRMFPWDGDDAPVTPRDMLDHHALGFRYDFEITTDGDKSEMLAARTEKRSDGTIPRHCQYE